MKIWPISARFIQAARGSLAGKHARFALRPALKLRFQKFDMLDFLGGELAKQLGLAVGDALGLPALFLTPAEIRKRYGAHGITDMVGSDYHPVGSVSDDTQTAPPAPCRERRRPRRGARRRRAAHRPWP